MCALNNLKAAQDVDELCGSTSSSHKIPHEIFHIILVSICQVFQSDDSPYKQVVVLGRGWQQLILLHSVLSFPFCGFFLIHHLNLFLNFRFSVWCDCLLQFFDIAVLRFWVFFLFLSMCCCLLLTFIIVLFSCFSRFSKVCFSTKLKQNFWRTNSSDEPKHLMNQPFKRELHQVKR